MTYSLDLVPGSNRTIILGPDDFSTSGLYNYTLSSPIQFTSGDIIGVYQPGSRNSIVTLQRAVNGTNDITRINITDGSVFVKNMFYFNSELLVLPLTVIYNG